MLEDAARRDARELELLRRYHEDGDQQARDELVRRCTPLVRSMARRYHGRGEQLEDLVQVGMIGLVKAIDRFDVRLGRRFVSFASPNITGEMKRHFRDHCWSVHVPRGVQELDARIQVERRAATARGDREPTAEELAATLGLPLDQIQDAIVGAQGFNTFSLDHPLGDDRVVIDRHGAPDRGYVRVEDEAAIADAMEALDDRERSVVDWRFRDELLQREIAERVGVSQMQVSRILTRSIERMAQRAAAPAA